MIRKLFFICSSLILLANLVARFVSPPVLWSMVVFLPLIYIGYRDAFQTKQAIRRNYPVLGNVRYLFEKIRPEINPYFVESNSEGVPSRTL
jgi:hypothetical protein